MQPFFIKKKSYINHISVSNAFLYLVSFSCLAFILSYKNFEIELKIKPQVLFWQIGSCPGFEDGEFESAKLLRPAASFYHDTDDCLYIVDSEV